MFRRLLPVLLALSLGAPVASAAPPRTVPVAGTVKVSTSYSMVIEVRLPKPVAIGYGFAAPKGSSITGNGRVVGVLLLDAASKGIGFNFLKYGFCATAGCTSKQPALYFNGWDGSSAGGPKSLPAGDYRLVIVTDGAPVTAVLKFPGLSGAVTLKPTRKIAVKHMVPDYLPADAGLPANTVYTGAADMDIDGGQGIVLHQFQATVDTAAQRQSAFCVFNGTIAYQPAPTCPGGHGNDITITQVYTDQRYSRLYGFEYYLHAGATRAGHYWRTVGVAHDPIGVISWIILPAR